jgi:uncharacterized membrane protein
MIMQLLWSFISRPYVTVLLVAFLVLSWREQGSARTFAWFVSGYLVAFSAEWGSINHGIPFGWYAYRYDALANDLVLFGVPFFDSVSFVFLSYISFSFAQFLLSPLLVAAWFDVRRLRNSVPVLVLGAVLMVLVDLVVDPLALLGKYWFLGEIYYYREPGPHFGVPMTNYVGWFCVALIIIALNQRMDGVLADDDAAGCKPFHAPKSVCNALFAPVLWSSIVLFQLGLTYWLAFEADSLGLDRERVMLQALAGTLTVAPILALAVAQTLKATNRADSRDSGSSVPPHGE